jgi:hypothetical protein
MTMATIARYSPRDAAATWNRTLSTRRCRSGTYDADDYDVFALPVDDTFRDVLR